MNGGALLVTCEREYHTAVQRVFELMVIDPAAGTREGEELAELVAAVERFERARYPISCCVFAARDCTARLLSVMRALGAVYDVEHAVQWCETPQPLLDGQRPVDLLITEAGAAEVDAEVDAVVARLHDGAYI